MFEKAFCVRRRKCCLSCGCGGYFAQLPSHTALSSAPSHPPTTLGSTLALCETPPQPCLGKQRRPPSRTLLVAPRPRPLLARKHGAKQKSADNTVSHTALAFLFLLLQALWHSGHALNGRSRRTTHTTATLTPTPTLGRNLLLPKGLCRPHSQAIGGNGDDDSNGDDDGNGMPHGDCDDEQPPPSASAPNADQRRSPPARRREQQRQRRRDRLPPRHERCLCACKCSHGSSAARVRAGGGCTRGEDTSRPHCQ